MLRATAITLVVAEGTRETTTMATATTVARIIISTAILTTSSSRSVFIESSESIQVPYNTHTERGTSSIEERNQVKKRASSKRMKEREPIDSG